MQRHHFIAWQYFVSLAALGIAGLASIPALLAENAPPATVPAGYRLVWSDEFDHGSVPDPSKWGYETGYVRNHELQYYTTRPENVRVEDGCLVLEARKEAIPLNDGSDKVTAYTSGSIMTLHKAAWKDGRIEVRAKFSVARGTWPAIWMVGADEPKVGWPKCGEIDVMESVGFDPDHIYGSIHTAQNGHTGTTRKFAVKDLASDFHIYGIDWNAERIIFSVDHHDYFTATNDHKAAVDWPFTKPFYMKLNFAIGGDWGGTKGVDDSAFPHKMLVDYVRVYQPIR